MIAKEKKTEWQRKYRQRPNRAGKTAEWQRAYYRRNAEIIKARYHEKRELEKAERGRVVECGF